MIRALESAQTPAYVSFRAPIAAPAGDDQSTTTSAAGGTDTTTTGTQTTAAGSTETTAGAPTDTMTLPTVSQDQAASIVQRDHRLHRTSAPR